MQNILKIITIKMNIGKFLLFKNPNKKESKHPDWKLNLEIDGKLVEVGGAWSNTSAKGEYISGKINNNVKIDVQVEAYKKPETQTNAGFSNPEKKDEVNLDEIPF